LIKTNKTKQPTKIMKKLIVLLALVALPAGVFAQGAISFANASSSPDTRFKTNDLAGHVGNITGVNQFLIGLYTAPDGTTDQSLFTLRLTATNNSSPLFPGLFKNVPVSIAGVPIGVQIAYQVRAWSFQNGGLTDTYENAPGNAYKGKTAIGFVTAADPAAGSPTLIFGTGAGQIGTTTELTAVPEPSSIALGLLGLGAIALFRRRK